MKFEILLPVNGVHPLYFCFKCCKISDKKYRSTVHRNTFMFNLAPGNSSYSDPLPWHRVSKLTLCWNCKTHSHNPNEPGENQVGHCETIPRRVVEEIIASTSVVDEDHHCYRQSSKSIQWPDSSRLPCFNLDQQR